MGGKKRKRNASSDHSDGELSPTSPSKALEEDMLAVSHVPPTDTRLHTPPPHNTYSTALDFCQDFLTDVCHFFFHVISLFHQKRRSNRQVKRKKYTEDLDIKITDDEDEPEEDVDVTTTTAAVASITGGATGQLMGEQLKQELQLDGDGLSSMQFFVVSVRF